MENIYTVREIINIVEGESDVKVEKIGASKLVLTHAPINNIEVKVEKGIHVIDYSILFSFFGEIMNAHPSILFDENGNIKYIELIE